MDEEKMGPGSMNHQGPMDHSHYCGYCGMWGMHGGHRHGLLRLLLGLFILLMVFWLGMKLGEFKGEFSGMGDYGGYGSYYGRHMMVPQPMMLWGNSGFPQGMMRATTTPLK